MSIQPPDSDTNFYDFILALLSQLQWLLGLLAGALLGVFVQRLGRVRFSILRWKPSFRNSTNPAYAESACATFEYAIQFYNGKSCPTSFRRGEFRFKSGNKTLHKAGVFDHLNIDPGLHKTIEDSVYFHGTSAEEVWNCDHVEFVALTPRGWDFKRPICGCPALTELPRKIVQEAGDGN